MFPNVYEHLRNMNPWIHKETGRYQGLCEHSRTDISPDDIHRRKDKIIWILFDFGLILNPKRHVFIC